MYIYITSKRNQAGNHATGHYLTVLNRTSNFSIMSVAKRLSTFRTAVLHQAAPPPAIGGIVKPPKPNGKAHRIGFETNAPADRLNSLSSGHSTGYRDSAADIAYCLRAAGETVVTPNSPPDPLNDPDWSYPDTEKGILAAVQSEPTSSGVIVPCGQTILWFISEPSSPLGVRFVAQDPLDTENYDDKAWTNDWLNRGELEGKFPKSWLIEKGDAEDRLREITLPAVLKPIRGEGVMV